MENTNPTSPLVYGDETAGAQNINDLQNNQTVLPEDNQLIFGKFRTMEEAAEAFKAAENAVAEATMLKQELQEYKNMERHMEEDAIAKKKGFSDRMEMALNFDVKQKELENYLLAGSRLLKPQQYLTLNQLIRECRGNCSRDDLVKIRRLFSPEVVALVSEDVALYKHVRQYEYDNMREQEKAIRRNRKIEDFKKLAGEWANSDFNRSLIEQAMELSDGQIDLTELKKVIDQIESDAVKRFQKHTAIRQENEAAQDQLVATESSKNRHHGKKWLTKEEFYKMTPEQEAEKYDLLVEQIKLENQGLLPRMLTK